MADLVPRGRVVEDTAGSALTPRGKEVVDLKGYLEDPEQDQAAYDKARQMADFVKPGAMERFKRAGIMGLSGPMQGLYSALTGEGYEFGTAVDRYYGDIVAENSGEMGDLAEAAGSVLTPVGPAGKMARGVRGAAEAAGVGAGLSALNTGTDPEASMGDVGRSALIGGLLSGGASTLGRYASPSTPLPERTNKSLLDAAIKGGAAGASTGWALGSPTIGGVLGSGGMMSGELMARMMAGRGTLAPMLTQSAPVVGSTLEQILEHRLMQDQQRQ